MNKIYECANCGIVTEEKGHLCSPIALENQGDYCGQTTAKTAAMCGEEMARFEYECGSCGRPAEKADLVCIPKKVQ